MNSIIKALLLSAVLALSFALPASAQSNLNQLRLSTTITSVAQTTATVTANGGTGSLAALAVGDTFFVDREAMVLRTVNTTSGAITFSRGQQGTAAQEHLAGTITYNGAANRFYFRDPPFGRCTASTAYSPGGFQPWINVLTGDVFSCDQLNGPGATVAGRWRSVNLNPFASTVPYTAIPFRTSGSPLGTNVSAYTVLLSDYFVASMTYQGTFEVFLPAATGQVGKQFLIGDAAGLADGSPSGRTITVRGVFGPNGTSNTQTISTASGVLRVIGMISSTSAYSWFISW